MELIFDADKILRTFRTTQKYVFNFDNSDFDPSPYKFIAAGTLLDIPNLEN